MNRQERRRQLKQLDRVDDPVAQTPVVSQARPATVGGTQASVTVQRTHYEGPLPKAEELQRYEQALPGAADRIITMAEKQAEHRRGLENRIADSNIAREKDGQRLGAGLFVFTVGVGAFLITQGFGTAGLVAIVGAATSAVTVFIVGKKKRDQNLQQKRQ
jgi:uncharacterized membrane protein